MKKISVKINDVEIGSTGRAVVQTMCNTHTQEIEKSVAQCKRMIDAGAEIIRLTTQGIKEVEALESIKAELRREGYKTPLVADVHFSSEVAIAAAKVADKVRINPGNFAKEHTVAQREFSKFLAVCKEYGTAVRIGLNHGSLGERIINLYGDTPLGMKEAVMEWLDMCIKENFYNVVISLKASNTVVMVNAYRLLYKAMEERGILFPLHLGVTEAGNGDMGRIKSAVGIGALLGEGMGDTIRVSLTEDPVNEIPAAQTLSNYFADRDSYSKDYESIKDAMTGSVKPVLHYKEKSWNDFIIKASALFGPLLLDKKIDDFDVSCTINGEHFGKSSEKILEFKDNLMQASRRKFTKPEYIACPGCGRTLYNLEETFNEVKRRTAHLKGVRIAVMGCIVNGPGEMADADYGYVGEGRGKVAIYKGKEAVKHSVPQEEAIDALLEIIAQDQSR